ncbi:MAG: 50S ribosomal protein L13 [Candidatus Curtissbacteria bacterium]|nr:50S ribosomal protein L13 [Candidatus Curtissbacteria bacterium]
MKNQKSKTLTKVEVQNNQAKAWYLFDAKSKVLGRLASEIASILSGKNKVDYVPYLDKGDFVVVINAKEIKVSGKKESQKLYYRHSGYPGGLKSKSVQDTREEQPEQLIRHAVVGMLPRNRLARQMVKKLYVFSGKDHPYQDKFLKN